MITVYMKLDSGTYEDLWGFEIQFHAFFTRHYMEVSGQLHSPAALFPDKEPMKPTGYEAGWIPEPLWMQW
jgi:hypothetical protein